MTSRVKKYPLKRQYTRKWYNRNIRNSTPYATDDYLGDDEPTTPNKTTMMCGVRRFWRNMLHSHRGDRIKQNYSYFDQSVTLESDSKPVFTTVNNPNNDDNTTMQLQPQIERQQQEINKQQMTIDRYEKKMALQTTCVEDQRMKIDELQIQLDQLQKERNEIRRFIDRMSQKNTYITIEDCNNVQVNQDGENIMGDMDSLENLVTQLDQKCGRLLEQQTEQIYNTQTIAREIDVKVSALATEQANADDSSTMEQLHTIRELLENLTTSKDLCSRSSSVRRVPGSTKADQQSIPREEQSYTDQAACLLPLLVDDTEIKMYKQADEDLCDITDMKSEELIQIDSNCENNEVIFQDAAVQCDHVDALVPCQELKPSRSIGTQINCEPWAEMLMHRQDIIQTQVSDMHHQMATLALMPPQIAGIHHQMAALAQMPPRVFDIHQQMAALALLPSVFRHASEDANITGNSLK